jgi:hypothetical protein
MASRKKLRTQPRRVNSENSVNSLNIDDFIESILSNNNDNDFTEFTESIFVKTLKTLNSLDRQFISNTRPMPLFVAHMTENLIGKHNRSDMDIYIGSIIASVSDPVIHKKCINAYKKQTAIFFRNQFAELVKFIDLNNSGLTPATRMKIFNKSIQLISELDIKSEKELTVMQSKINLKILKIRHNVSDSFMYNELSNIVKFSQSEKKQ